MPELLVCIGMADKPFVAAAFFCESLLQEADRVISAVRIVDTYMLQAVGPVPAELPDGAVRGMIVLKGLISIKSDSPLSGRLHLVMHKTTKEKSTISPADGWPVDLQGDESGFNLLIQMPLGIRNFGLIWFDVLWGSEILTRIPLRLKEVEASAEPTVRNPQNAGRN